MPDSTKKLIIGNWKMNGLKAPSLQLTQALIQSFIQQPELLTASEVVICPPFPLLISLADITKKTPVTLGAQNCHHLEKGAYTGEISASMVKDAGGSYVILGHSERRHYQQESNEDVAAKAVAAYEAGLTAIICIGETLEEYNAGKTLDILQAQLAGSIPAGANADNTVIAYEPVWAIGTGKIPTADEITVAHDFIYKTAINTFEKAPKILYGGSVKPDNAEEILKIQHVGGLLVGGASLKAEDFLAIIASAKQPVSC